jgi:hypothetical protein
MNKFWNLQSRRKCGNEKKFSNFSKSPLWTIQNLIKELRIVHILWQDLGDISRLYTTGNLPKQIHAKTKLE